MSIDDNFLLDWGARVGIQARLERLAKTQVEGLISSLEYISDKRACLLLTAAFAHRQAERLGKGARTARLLNTALSEIHKRGGGREEARRLLGIAKWVFETVENKRLPWDVSSDTSKLTFTEYLEKILRRI